MNQERNEKVEAARAAHAEAVRYRDEIRERVEVAKRARAAADEAFVRVAPHDWRAQQDASARRDEARRSLAQLESALGTAEVALEAAAKALAEAEQG